MIMGRAASCILTCFDHNSSKSTNFAASDISWKRSRGAVNVGELLIRIGSYFCYENGAASCGARETDASKTEDRKENAYEDGGSS